MPKDGARTQYLSFMDCHGDLAHWPSSLHNNKHPIGARTRSDRDPLHPHFSNHDHHSLHQSVTLYWPIFERRLSVPSWLDMWNQRILPPGLMHTHRIFWFEGWEEPFSSTHRPASYHSIESFPRHWLHCVSQNCLAFSCTPVSLSISLMS